jgi:hypothetical protein
MFHILRKIHYRIKQDLANGANPEPDESSPHNLYVAEADPKNLTEPE